MKLLLVAATEAEITPFIQYLQQNWAVTAPLCFKKQETEVSICITGVGMVATTYALTKAFQSQTYDLALQAGVGGSFDTTIPLGSLVLVTTDRFADLGAEDHNAYLDIFDMGLLQPDAYPYTNKLLRTPVAAIADIISLPQASALTVNTVSGSEPTIQMRAARYNAQVESMEGAAFHYVCLHEQVPFAQVRAISNYVIPRDKSQWQMKDAIIGLNKWLINTIEAF
jgi:futalosine hydrolase